MNIGEPVTANSFAVEFNLIPGKEYKVKGYGGDCLLIENELVKDQWYSLDYSMNMRIDLRYRNTRKKLELVQQIIYAFNRAFRKYRFGYFLYCQRENEIDEGL